MEKRRKSVQLDIWHSDPVDSDSAEHLAHARAYLVVAQILLLVGCFAKIATRTARVLLPVSNTRVVFFFLSSFFGALEDNKCV